MKSLTLTLLMLTTCILTVSKCETGNAEIIRELQSTVAALGRQLIMQQLFVEERIRSEGSSGLKQIRLQTGGSRPYHSTTFVGNSLANIHDHINYDRTLGMGETIAVLNGVEFRTRHNDYKLKMPCRRKQTLHCTEDIPFPKVPRKVISKESVSDQIAEMKEYFRAWKEQDSSIRRYSNFFKPVLCYLEGAWMKSSASLQESFASDRHFLDATSWFDLHQKARFSAASGRKDNLENFAYLPVTIAHLTGINGTIPEFAQWNYRILCHPLSQDVPFNRFRTVDDLHSRMAFKAGIDQQTLSRRARFQLNPEDSDHWGEGRFYDYGFLDSLMEQIPGKDNYRANLTDDLFGDVALRYEDDEDGSPRVLNAGFYHRWFKVTQKGADGRKLMHRGYSDQNVFMAMTSQPDVVGLNITNCARRGRDCVTVQQKWTYAIPLEIVYMTPLSRWNPYDLEYKGLAYTDEGMTVKEGNRNGQKTVDKAFNGINNALYYQTPVEMFARKQRGDTADTGRYGVGVLDKNGVVRTVDASGFRVKLNIADVGEIRQRWPIMPASVEGSTIMKEIDALKDMVMDQQRYINMYRESPLALATGTTMAPVTADQTLETSLSTSAVISQHSHTLVLDADSIQRMKDGAKIAVRTSTDNGHFHELKVFYNSSIDRFQMFKCDLQNHCWDGHDSQLWPSDG